MSFLAKSLLKNRPIPSAIVTPFEKMPWGYTVRGRVLDLPLNTDSLKYRVYLNLKTEGVFSVSNCLVLNTTAHGFHSQRVNSIARPRKPFGTLMVSFHRSAHSQLKTQPLIRHLCYLSTHTWSPFCRCYSSRTYRHCPFC